MPDAGNAPDSVRYRAYCKTEQRYCGPWREERADARRDCHDHDAEPGNESHLTTVMMEQGAGGEPIDAG